MDMSPAGTLTLLDPRTPGPRAMATTAPRPPRLVGQRVGLLANGKANSAELLAALGALLRERALVGELVTAAKADSSRVAPPDLLDRLAARCDVVVTAVGD